MRHLDWYRHRHLPHCDQPGKIQSVTIRLADSMPAAKLREWEELAKRERSRSGRRGDEALECHEFLKRLEQFEAYLDAGHGACHLRDPAVAAMVHRALLHGDGTRYDLLAWVIMPNHLHWLFEMRAGWPLGEVIKRFKTFTAHEANRILNRTGRFWYPDYWDRYVRSGRHLRQVIDYIHRNPVKANLVAQAEDWPWSSARSGARETSRPVDHDGFF